MRFVAADDEDRVALLRRFECGGFCDSSRAGDQEYFAHKFETHSPKCLFTGQYSTRIHLPDCIDW